jgi:hypothetical protein
VGGLRSHERLVLLPLVAGHFLTLESPPRSGETTTILKASPNRDPTCASALGEAPTSLRDHLHCTPFFPAIVSDLVFDSLDLRLPALHHVYDAVEVLQPSLKT